MRHPIDRDEQHQLSVAQHVEYLSVVTTREHGVAFAHEQEGGDVLTRPQELGHGAADAGHRHTGLEE